MTVTISSLFSYHDGNRNGSGDTTTTTTNNNNTITSTTTNNKMISIKKADTVPLGYLFCLFFLSLFSCFSFSILPFFYTLLPIFLSLTHTLSLNIKTGSSSSSNATV